MRDMIRAATKRRNNVPSRASCLGSDFYFCLSLVSENSHVRSYILYFTE